MSRMIGMVNRAVRLVREMVAARVTYRLVVVMFPALRSILASDCCLYPTDPPDFVLTRAW